MKKRYLVAVAIIGVAVGAFAQAPVITSFHGNGQLSWTNSITNVAYRVEWASSLTGTWYQSWQPITYLEAHTNTGMSAEVPMFYRAVMMTNDLPRGMALVDSGWFQMGNGYTNESGNWWYDQETPVHIVYVSAFFMDKYEVTKTMWDVVYVWATNRGYQFDNQGSGLSSHHPVFNVNWYDSIKWCNARSEKEELAPLYYTTSGKTDVYRTGTNDLTGDCVAWDANGYGLATEAEWEKAARGGLVNHHYPWPSFGGAYSNHIDRGKANYSGSQDPYEPGTTPVAYYNGSQTPAGTDMANEFGLYDMAGNLREWCWDRFDQYEAFPLVDPRGPDVGEYRMLRGGAESSDILALRCSYRGSTDQPSEATGYNGFRCVRRQQ